MNIKFLTLLLALSILLTGCSWQQYFIIMNSTAKSVTIEYCISRNYDGFPIFGDDPEIFECNRNNNIIWERPVQQEVTTISDTIFRFTLDPGKASIIGRLSNDDYTSYNQYFINGRNFNLVYINIYSDKDTTTIYPENFDNIFKNDKGYITCKLS